MNPPDFIPLPSDPCELTAEHALAAFATGDIDGVLRDLHRQVARNSSRSIQNTTPETDAAASATGETLHAPTAAYL